MRIGWQSMPVTVLQVHRCLSDRSRELEKFADELAEVMLDAEMPSRARPAKRRCESKAKRVARCKQLCKVADELAEEAQERSGAFVDRMHLPRPDHPTFLRCRDIWQPVPTGNLH
jgi:HAMP domain-containing protein